MKHRNGKQSECSGWAYHRARKLSLRRKLFAVRILFGILIWGIASVAERSWADFNITPVELPAFRISESVDPLPALLTDSDRFREPAEKTNALEFQLPVSEAYFETALDLRSIPDTGIFYPAIAREKGWQGTVILDVAVNADGQAENVRIYESSGYRILDQAAVKAISKCRFNPARSGDTALASLIRIPFRFALQDKKPDSAF